MKSLPALQPKNLQIQYLAELVRNLEQSLDSINPDAENLLFRNIWEMSSSQNGRKSQFEPPISAGGIRPR